MLNQNWLKNWLFFNKKDRIGLLVFIFILIVCIGVPLFLKKDATQSALVKNDVLAEAVDTLEQRQLAKKSYNYERREYQPNSYRYEQSQTAAFTNGVLFQFDPNTITAADWQRMGLNEKTSKTIEKYVSKGGKFYKPEDLMRIWGMPEGFYERVKDYVMITSVQRNYPTYDNKPFVREERKLATVDINGADTSAFIALPGIGGKLSSRIVAFREKLGGFYSVEQIGETYGLPDSTFQKIKPRLQVGGEVRKINVNAATKDELKAHPYVRWNLANAIVEYRNQHGAFKSLEDLKDIVLIDEATFNKISHYLSL